MRIRKIMGLVVLITGLVSLCNASGALGLELKHKKGSNSLGYINNPWDLSQRLLLKPSGIAPSCNG
ncbi:MAG: hypothetical protein ACE5NG_17640 [bacterium]